MFHGIRPDVIAEVFADSVAHAARYAIQLHLYLPHKKNPISGENLCGLARVVKSNAIASLDNIALWHERDISHSSVERVIFPDSFILVHYMLKRFEKLLANLNVKKENMIENIEKYGGIIYSQGALLALCNKGHTREEAYKIVQQEAFDAYHNKQNFKDKTNIPR